MHDRFFPFIVVLVLALLAFVSSGRCEVGEVSHELTVRLLPEERMLEGVHRMRFSAPEEAKAGFFLNSDAGIISIEVNGRPGEYVYSSGRGEILLPEGRNIVDVVIRYEGTFDDPFQARPLSMDNPGFGVTGTIFEQGAFLPAGSGWYPLVDAKRETFRLTVSAPRGMQAVSAGRLESIRDEKDSTISIWDVENPVRGLSLSAGYYFMDRSRADGNRIYTFFSPGLKRLSPLYLRKTAEHISFFEKLHGPYAFPKFAVVENFFPTGYGFPSYTLLGASVLRLPFIPETSLRHEVAHCWWGHGVLVDYDQGHWSEGLST
ncbi:MAG: M1 family peptidase, partial [Desulfovibrionales bacterium]